jgi:phage terminase Nu1 subunit (DNA packaging protein)
MPKRKASPRPGNGPPVRETIRPATPLAPVRASVLAGFLGVTVKVIRERAAEGAFVPTHPGFFDLRASIAKYVAQLRLNATRRGGAEVNASAAAERGRLAKAQADKVEIANKIRLGTLVEAAAVETEWSGVLRTVRAGMLALPSRAAARLPHLTPHDVAEIDAEVRAVLTEVGNADR